MKTRTGSANGPQTPLGLSRREFLGVSVAAAVPALTLGPRASARTGSSPGFDDYVEFDGLGLADLVRRKEVPPEELLDAAIARIESINPKLNAVITKMYEEARRTIAAGLADGPFAGVPFLLKDLGASYSGVKLTGGARLFAEYVPQHDDELVTRYKAAGLVTVGRTNTPEFGLNPSTESVFLGPARNPWDPARSAGGSSGGSGAAVASRMVPIAHGSDGGGSIRIPSSCCGVFGMKPSRGRMPTGPLMGEIWEGFATNHALSLSVRDNAALLDATSDPEIGAPYGIPAPELPFVEEVTAEPGKLRIAFFTGVAGTDTHPDCIAAAEDAAKLCESLGHEVEEAAPAIDYDALRAAFNLIVQGHTAAMLDRVGQLVGTEVTPDGVEPMTWRLAERGWKASSADFAASKSIVNMATRTVAEFLKKYDAVLTPTLATPPPELGYLDTVNLSFEELQRRVFHFLTFTWLHNVTGLPAMSVPLGWNADGLPVGVQFAGRYADEATLYRLAGQLEQSRPWRDKVPPVGV
jgi:Asp-tRNA(Asn)/Glu-tRNA(Gln) amidotransferase A subunit family amidase